ncbi:peptidoglycan -binding protein [Aliiroseovarius sp. PTFE2010]|uniref:peptidoglycan -binding protein n=1 Tax=Aliiroseovarius sp. PTFE2010 TaxID=3417190 RepID=UPI003CEC75BF
MALTRRATQRMSGAIWPGFVDAMTALLLVLMFVLTIFMVVQTMLRDTITGQESELEALAGEVDALARALGLEQQRAFDLGQQVSRLTDDVQQAQAQADRQRTLIATLRSQIGEQSDRIASFEEQVAALLSERDAALGQMAALEQAQTRLIDEQEALNLALANARQEIDAQAEAARLAAARREALEALIASLESDAETRQSALEDARTALQRERSRAADLLAALTAAQDKAALSAEELAAARARVDETTAALSAAEEARLAEAAAAQALRKRLADADAELTAMTLALEEKRKEAEETLTLLAAARSETAALARERQSELSEAERNAGLLAAARSALAEQKDISADAQRKVALLNEQLAELRSQLSTLQAILDASAAEDETAQVQIETLTGQLNAALARAASEQRRRAQLEEAERERLEKEAQRLAEEARSLANYRSEFFGRMREILGDLEGVRIVGDRFVFSSEVLFATGSAQLSAGGRAQIAQVADTLSGIADDIPPQIDWVIRVDGHTDSQPIFGGRYADNWELSQARALSVVRYMTDGLGFPPERLAATGFGEYQPVAKGDSPAALAANRRIELKLTEK